MAVATQPKTAPATATAVIYLRVSSQGQVNTAHDPEGYSIPAQRAAALRHAESLGAQVVAEFVELGRTGTTTRRDALQRLLAELPKLRPTYVIIYDLSRLARDDFDALWLLAEIEKHGAKLESTLERIDDSPAGRLLYTVMAGVNAFRSRGDAVKVKSGLERKFLAGGHMGPAPIGYLNAKEIVADREVAVVVPDPDRVELVQMAFELFATGDYSITQLVDILEDAGLRYRATPKKPSKPMNRSMVHRMLRDDFYIGIVTLKGAKRDGIHTPIIDRELFEQVQSILSAHRASGDRSHKHSHFLKGSLHCECGCRLGYGRHKGASGGMYEYFSCLSRVRRRGSCQAPYIPVEATEQAVERMNRRIVLTNRSRKPSPRPSVIMPRPRHWSPRKRPTATTAGSGNWATSNRSSSSCTTSRPSRSRSCRPSNVASRPSAPRHIAGAKPRSPMSRTYSRPSRSRWRWWMRAGCRMQPPMSSANG